MKVSDERCQSVKDVKKMSVKFYVLLKIPILFLSLLLQSVEGWLLWWVKAIQRYIKSYVTWDKKPNYTALKYDKADFILLHKVDFKNKKLPEHNNFVLIQEIVLLTGNLILFY